MDTFEAGTIWEGQRTWTIGWLVQAVPSPDTKTVGYTQFCRFYTETDRDG